jgi:hypothetical protein
MANPTTNYGWVLPTSTDLVTDLPADFEIALQGVDTTTKSLDDANLKKSIIDAAGDLIYGTANDTAARLALGTAGQVLTVNSGATAPEWKTAAAGGKVLQVVQGTTTTQTTITGATYVDTTLTASITPSAVSSKVLVLVSQNYEINRNGLDAEAAFRLFRGATSLIGNMRIRYRHSGTGTVQIYNNLFNYSYLDSPSTTSATTYKTQANAQDSITLQDSSLISSIILLEIGA